MEVMDPEEAPVTSVPGAALKRRLLERVADADSSHLTVGADDGRWQPFVEGVRIKVLRLHEGVMTYLLHLEPNAKLPPHRHRVDEECLVLQGSVLVGSHTEVGAGGYHLAHRGALHATVSTRTGATLFLRGAAPQAADVLD